MIALICFFSAAVITTALAIYFETLYDVDGVLVVAVIIAIVSWLGTVILIIGIPVNRSETREFIVKFESYRATVSSARASDDLTSYERVAFLKEIAELNASLAGRQFDNHRQWDYWVDDAIDSVRPIQ